MDCHWISYGMMGGNKIRDFDLSKFLRKRIHFISTTLRNRSDLYKEELIDEFKKESLPKFSDGIYKPVIDKIFNYEEINEAHMRMEENINIGKIIINWDV